MLLSRGTELPRAKVGPQLRCLAENGQDRPALVVVERIRSLIGVIHPVPGDHCIQVTSHRVERIARQVHLVGDDDAVIRTTFTAGHLWSIASVQSFGEECQSLAEGVNGFPFLLATVSTSH